MMIWLCVGGCVVRDIFTEVIGVRDVFTCNGKCLELLGISIGSLVVELRAFYYVGCAYMYFLGKMVFLDVSETFSRELLVSGMFLHVIGSVWNYWGFPSDHWL